MDFSMPLDEAMRTQRAIRRLKPDPVDDALVLRLIELALKAPSGSNQQNWEFVIVKNRAVKEKLGALNRGMFRFYGGLGRRMAQNQPKMLRRANTAFVRLPSLRSRGEPAGPRDRRGPVPVYRQRPAVNPPSRT
jgi:nitroreductase